MTRHRILHCIHGMGGGGAERQLAYLDGKLVTRGWDVHVALVSGGPNLDRLQASGATLHRIAAASNYDPRILWRLLGIVDAVQPHVVQVWILQMEILGALAARIRRVPWILSERCSEPAYPPSVKHRAREWLTGSAAAIVANSSGGKEYWDARLAGHVPRYVIPNALPLEEMRTVAAVDARVTNIPDSDALVLFAGRLTGQKNAGTLLQALGLLLDRPGWTAVIAGEGPLRESLGWAAAGGLHRRVRFVGYLENLWGWMKRASVFVSPSRFEGHPNTVLEAAGCGCPLVVSAIPAHVEFLGPEDALLVDAEDAHALAGAIRRTLDDPAAAAARAQRAAQRVAAWTADTMARAYEQVYERVIETAGRR